MHRIASGLLLLPLVLAAQTQDDSREKKDFFENRIRPMLAQSCFVCHTNSQMAGLRLDSRADILKGGVSGPALVPGDPDKSLLLNVVREGKMPKSGHLQEQQIADLAKWIKDGAYWPDPLPANARPYTITAKQRELWSIQPLRHPAPPAVKNTTWPLNDVDRFVLARLEKEGLQPSPAADRRTLLRRVTYDLTGLPPTEEEVKAFEADKSPKAYETVIDRLLASPHYGETWGRHWLDVVRYAEDDYNIGNQPLHMEQYKNAYVYRDWVINSMNQDMPYDQFVKAQIAADQMDEKVRAKMIPGLGMNGLGVWAFDANPPIIQRADEWNDKVDTTTKAFLGLTVGCARCHDHKYDAIPTKDYYRLVSVFASTKYHAYPLVPKAVVDDYQAKKKELEEKEKAKKKYLDDLARLYAQSLLSQTEDYMVAVWRVKTQKRSTPAGVAEQYKLDPEMLDRWIRFSTKPTLNYSTMKPWQTLLARGGSLDEAQTLARDFYLKAAAVSTLHDKLEAENEIELAKYKLADDQYDSLPNGLKRKLNPNQIDLKGMDREDSYLWRDMFDKDLGENPDNIDKQEQRPPALLKLEDWALERRLSPDLAKYVAHLKTDIEDFKKAMPAPYPYIDGLEDDKQPTNVKVFLRGSPYNFGEEAPRAFLSILSPAEPELFKQGSGRMELADAIVKQPLSMRVIVNRVWRWHMGSGIVDTPNNFGRVGDPPSNPELLDYLTTQFIDSGMSIKTLHKQILLSRTYQLSTATDEATAAKDSDNRLYSHANRRRLEAENIWDSLLTASGKLDLSKVGGPSEEYRDQMTRRGVYGSISRVFPNNFETTFDLPTPTFSAEKRYATNVPLQRLFFLNSPFVERQADGLAQRVHDAGSDEEQVRKAFAIVFQRQPTSAELQASVEFLHLPVAETPRTSMGNPIAAKPETRSVETATPAAPSASPLKWLCWALLSSNEFLFVN
jgi:hypothetical protein